jgi:hypothetical protein
VDSLRFELEVTGKERELLRDQKTSLDRELSKLRTSMQVSLYIGQPKIEQRRKKMMSSLHNFRPKVHHTGNVRYNEVVCLQ